MKYMKHLKAYQLFLTVATLVLGISSHAELSSSIPSSIKGISIPNAHILQSVPSTVIRGQAPGSKLNELLEIGITDVIILKEATADVVSEMKELESHGLKSNQIHQVDMKWKDFNSQKQACQQTVQGLKTLVDLSRKKARVIYFHCTVGEDRTGVIAGLFRMITQGWSTKNAFKKEMCARGYESGEPHKPLLVVQKIQESLTPVYEKLGLMIESGALNITNLGEEVCENSIFKEQTSPKLICKAN